MTQKAGHFLLGFMLAGSIFAAEAVRADTGAGQGGEVVASGETPMLKLIREFANQPLFQFIKAFRLLYTSETPEPPDFSIAVTGRQFAWHSEYKLPYREKQPGA